MRGRKLLLFSTVSLFAMSSMAMAQEGNRFNWGGMYLGVHAGVGSGTSKADISDITMFEGYSGQETSTENFGMIGGGQIGYNWQSRRFVFGVEADISALGGMKKSYHIQHVDSEGLSNISQSMSGLATIRARVGIDVADGTLLYTTFGAGFLNTKNNMNVLETSGSAPKGGNFKSSSWRPALVIGGGVEHMLTEHVSLRGEALWVQAQSERAGAKDPSYFDADNQVQYEHSLVLGRLGLNYKF
ncbi:MAG: outer membrane protein [Hyphomicrobiaceae bacterium]